MTIKRHSPREISAKLQQAEEMARQGKTQREIAQAIGVSVMTYHRWRKPHRDEPSGAAAGRPVCDDEILALQKAVRNVETHTATSMDELLIENARLRNLVADLLLEKVRIEETLRHRRK